MSGPGPTRDGEARPRIGSAADPERRLARAALLGGALGILLAPILVGLVPATIGLQAGLANLRRRGEGRVTALVGIGLSAIGGVASILAALVLGAILITMLLSRSAARQAAEWEGRRIPGFTVELADGGRLGPDELRGKTILLDFFSPYAPPCPRNIALIEEFVRGRSDAIAIGVAPELAPAEALRFARTHGATYPIAATNDGWPDPLATVAPRPALIVLAPSGVITKVALGPLEDGQVARLAATPEPDARSFPRP